MKKEVKNDSVEETATELPKTESSSPSNESTNLSVEGSAPKENAFTKIIEKGKAFGMAKIIAIAAVVIVVAALAVVKVATSSPKAVFKNAINGLYKEASKELKEMDSLSEKFDFENKAIVLSGDTKLDTNIKEVSKYDIDLKNTTIGAEVGVNLKKEELSFGGYIKGASEQIDIDVLVKENAAYIASNIFDDVVKVEEDVDIDFSEIKEAWDKANEEVEIDPELYDAILKSVTKALTKSLDTEYMEKESDEVEVAGKEIKVTKHSYTFNDDAVSDMIKSIATTLLDDSDFISNLAKATGQDKSDIKDALKEMKDEAKDIEFDGKIVLNVYTKGLLNKIVGLSLDVDKKEYLSIYSYGKNAELTIDNHSDGYSQVKVNVKAEKDGKETKVTVKYNGEKVATAKVREFSEEKIDFDFEITYQEETIKGSIYFTCKESKKDITGEYKVKVEYDDQYLSAEGKYGVESKDELDKVDTSNAVSADDVDEEEILENLEKIAEKDETFKILYEEAYKTYEEESLNLNYYDMAVINNIEDVKKVLTKTRGTVLYVGSTYYAGDTSEASTIFNNLVKAQEEIGFHTYYFMQYNVNDSFRELVKDVTPVCNTTQTEVPTTEGETPTTPTCSEYPIVYFIKDGKVVKAVQGSITEEELTKSLSEIGLEKK